jgi:hypothetical protein
MGANRYQATKDLKHPSRHVKEGDTVLANHPLVAEHPEAFEAADFPTSPRRPDEPQPDLLAVAPIGVQPEGTGSAESAESGLFTPMGKTVEEVLDYLHDADAVETNRVLDLEMRGQARKTLVGGQE